MIVLEAMSCETPLVAGNGSDTPELIESGKNGLLIPPKDSAALANSIASLLQDRQFAARLGHEGRKRVIEKFSAKITADSTLRVYEKMIRTIGSS